MAGATVLYPTIREHPATPMVGVGAAIGTLETDLLALGGMVV
ncbi:hypothetical protein [Halalkaliarchaeum desulfuricum]|nr:hypothetical protein [Halalkaliarchaeum desulfuricum]